MVADLTAKTRTGVRDYMNAAKNDSSEMAYFEETVFDWSVQVDDKKAAGIMPLSVKSLLEELKKRDPTIHLEFYQVPVLRALDRDLRPVAGTGGEPLSTDEILKKVPGDDARQFLRDIMDGKTPPAQIVVYQKKRYEYPRDWGRLSYQVMNDIVSKLNSDTKSRADRVSSALPPGGRVGDLVEMREKPCLYADSQCVSTRSMKWGLVKPSLRRRRDRAEPGDRGAAPQLAGGAR